MGIISLIIKQLTIQICSGSSWLLSILWWKISARWSSHYMLWLTGNCLKRHRTTNTSLSSLWIAVESLGLKCDTRCLHWNGNRATTHSLSHRITSSATRKSPCLLLKIKKYRLQVSFQIFCYCIYSPCRHLTNICIIGSMLCTCCKNCHTSLTIIPYKDFQKQLFSKTYDHLPQNPYFLYFICHCINRLTD